MKTIDAIRDAQRKERARLYNHARQWKFDLQCACGEHTALNLRAFIRADAQANPLPKLVAAEKELA